MRGSIQKRSKGSWRLVFDLERDRTGKRRQKVITYRGTKKDADAELSRLLADIENGGFVDPGNITVAEYLERWLGHVKIKTSAKTRERYGEIVRLALVPHLGTIKLAKLRPMDIQGFYAHALKFGHKQREGGLSARTVLHYHRILSQALKQAVKWQLLTRNPADAVEPPRPERKEMIVLDEDQTATLLEGAQDTTLYIPSLLAVTTGLRRGEILALRWRDVDFDRGTLAVTQSLEETKDGLRFKQPKTKRSRRVVTLPSITIDALRRHRIEQAQLRLQLGLGRDDNGLVCSRYDGQPRSPRAFTKEFTRLVAKLDIPRTTFHGLRHSHATQLLRAGIHPKIAQERLGHSTIATTMDLYSHVTDTMQEDAAAQIHAGLQAAIGKRKRNKS